MFGLLYSGMKDTFVSVEVHYDGGSLLVTRLWVRYFVRYRTTI